MHPVSSLVEITEQVLIDAHKAGIAYWRSNRPSEASRESLESLARSCGWHGEANYAWISGFYRQKERDENEAFNRKLWGV